MTVRRHVPVAVQVGGAAFVILVAVGAGMVLARVGFVQAWLGDPSPEIGRLVEENRALRIEHDRLLELGNTTDSRAAMERSTIRELGDQVARLEAENTRLKEDIAFFEAATAGRPSSGALDAASGIAIRRFQVTVDPVTHVARYRLLLTQDSRATRDFAGELQLVLGLVQGGRTVDIVLPAKAGDGAPARPADDAANFAFAFRSYKRIDGTFDILPGEVLRSVQARILERGAIRVQQTVTLD